MTARTLKEFPRGLDDAELKAEVENTRGRPMKYTEEHAQRILDVISEGGSVRQACEADDDLPSPSSFHRWVVEDKFGLRLKYQLAREVQARSLADDLLVIADDERRDFDGDGRPNHAAVQRDRLRLHARQWILGRVLPREYGDKGMVEHHHVVEQRPEMDYSKLSIDELEQLQALMAKAKADGESKVVENTSADATGKLLLGQSLTEEQK